MDRNVFILIVCAVIFIWFFVLRGRFSARVQSREIEMKHQTDYQVYGMKAQAFFDEVKQSFQTQFALPFRTKCPNYYKARIYGESDDRYRLVIDTGNRSAVAILNLFQFEPDTDSVSFWDDAAGRTANWLVKKLVYVYRQDGWELSRTLHRDQLLEALYQRELHHDLDLETARTLSYTSAEEADAGERALCGIATRQIAQRAADLAGLELSFQEAEKRGKEDADDIFFDSE